MDIKKINGIRYRFFKAIRNTYKVYLSMEHGSRSPKKSKILVIWIKQELKTILGNKYTIISMYDGTPGSPVEPVMGKYYKKNVNISVSRDGKVVGIISVRFVNSSLKKNTNNYIEGQLGLIANLRSNNIVFGSLFCLTDPVPQYTKNTIGNIKYITCTDIERIEDSDIETYHTLVSECPKPLHAPDVQGICIAKSDVIIGKERKDTKITSLAKPETLSQLNDTNLDIVFNEMNIETFFTNFVKKVEAKSQQSRLRKFFNCFLQKIIDACHCLKK